jgi:hypothetical protein
MGAETEGAVIGLGHDLVVGRGAPDGLDGTEDLVAAWSLSWSTSPMATSKPDCVRRTAIAFPISSPWPVFAPVEVELPTLRHAPPVPFPDVL